MWIYMFELEKVSLAYIMFYLRHSYVYDQATGKVRKRVIGENNLHLYILVHVHVYDNGWIVTLNPHLAVLKHVSYPVVIVHTSC